MGTKITIVYDNCPDKTGLKTGWGFSALVETDSASPVLFDTGDDGAALMYNIERLGIVPEQVGAIVISHAHADHAGGLPAVLKVNENAVIYLPASMAIDLPGRKVVKVSRPLQISGCVHSTGELNAMEQSLAIETGRGILVLTGCSHPGVGAILDAASAHGRVFGIIGGLHGFRDFNRLDGLELICPCHCTRYKKELAQMFPGQYRDCGAGLELTL